MTQFQARTPGGDGLTVNGLVGATYAELKLSQGEIDGSKVGVHMAGGFGGLSLVEMDVVLSTEENLLVDNAVTAQQNRELWLTNTFLDSSFGDNMVVNEPTNMAHIFLNGDSIETSSGHALNFIHCNCSIHISNSLISRAGYPVTGGTIPGKDGIRWTPDGSTITITGSQIFTNTGYGIDLPTTGAPGTVAADLANVFGVNTLGDFNNIDFVTMNAGIGPIGQATITAGPMGLVFQNHDAGPYIFATEQNGKQAVIVDSGVPTTSWLSLKGGTTHGGIIGTQTIDGGADALEIDPPVITAPNLAVKSASTVSVCWQSGQIVFGTPGC